MKLNEIKDKVIRRRSSNGELEYVVQDISVASLVNYDKSLLQLFDEFRELNAIEGKIQKTKGDLRRSLNTWGVDSQDVLTRNPYENTVENDHLEVMGHEGAGISTNMREAISSSRANDEIFTSRTQIDKAELIYQRAGRHIDSPFEFQVRNGSQILASNDESFRMELTDETIARISEELLQPLLVEVSERKKTANDQLNWLSSELSAAKDATHPKIIEAKKESVEINLQEMEALVLDTDIPSDNMKKIDAQGISPTMKQISSSMLKIAELRREPGSFDDISKPIFVTDDANDQITAHFGSGSLTSYDSSPDRAAHTVFCSSDGRLELVNLGRTENRTRFHEIHVDGNSIMNVRISDTGEVKAYPACGFVEKFEDDPENLKRFTDLSKKVVAKFAVPLVAELNAARIDAIQMTKEAKELKNIREIEAQQKSLSNSDEMNDRINKTLDEFDAAKDTPAAP